MVKKEAGFLQIPRQVIQKKKIYSKSKGRDIAFTFGVKCVYSYLLHWKQNKQGVYPSQRRMCDDLGLSSRATLRKYLDQLTDFGLISFEGKQGRNTRYTINEVSCTQPDMNDYYDFDDPPF